MPVPTFLSKLAAVTVRLTTSLLITPVTVWLLSVAAVVPSYSLFAR